MKRPLLVLLFLLLIQSAFSQVTFSLKDQYNGRFNFTMIGASFNNMENPAVPCTSLDVSTTPTDYLNLTPTQVIEKAYLYWSANLGATSNPPDEVVQFNGQTINSDETFILQTQGSGGTVRFFTCRADVTSQVQSTGNGAYGLEDLSIYRGGDCSDSYGGWSLLVIYEDPTEDLNTVNIYEGLQVVSGSTASLRINVSGLLVSQKIGSELGILSWEGDSALANGERVLFNGQVLSNAQNPPNNLFNSSNSFSGTTVPNMDVDHFDITSYVDVGDTDVYFQIESNQDLALMHVLAFKLVSYLPEPTVLIDSISNTCAIGEQVEMTIDFTVKNENANDTLPAGTSVKFFFKSVDTAPVYELFTDADIPIDSSKSYTIKIPAPTNLGDKIDLIAQINLDPNGDPILLELNPHNNEDERPYDLLLPPDIALGRLEACEISPGTADFDLDGFKTDFETDNPDIAILVFETEMDAINNQNPISGIYTNTTNPQTLYTRQTSQLTDCEGIVPLEIFVNPLPIANDSELETCSVTNVTGQFLLSDANSSISTEQNIIITFHETNADAESGVNVLPDSYSSESAIIFSRITNTITNCFTVKELELKVFESPIANPVSDIELCDDDDDEILEVNIETTYPEIYGNQDPNLYDISFYTTRADAENRSNEIANPSSFENSINPQEIFFRIENNQKTDCAEFGSFMISILPLPIANDVPLKIANCSSSTSGTFNLDLLIPEISNGNTVNVDVSFFSDLALTQRIINTQSYSSPAGTVYTKVANIQTGCYTSSDIDLFVNSTPTLQTIVNQLCADSENNQEAEFDLTINDEDFIDGFSNVTVSYHESFADANSSTQGGDNPITNPKEYVSTTKTIYVRLEADHEGNICQTVSELELVVNERPEANSVQYNGCSDNDQANFDLQSIITDITGGNLNSSVLFYESLSDAENENNNTINADNFNSISRTIYARVEDDQTGCSEIAPIELIVNKNPEIGNISSYSSCRVNGIASFDLDIYIAELESNFPNYLFTIFDSNDSNFSNPLTGVIQTETTNLVLLVVDKITACFSIETLTLEVIPTPTTDFGNVVICVSKGYTLPDGTVTNNPGEYVITIQDPSTNCDIETRTNLILGDVSFPNAFSPNLDGENDMFRPRPDEDCFTEIVDYELTIYNRWGEKVFHSTDYSLGWNGIYEAIDGQQGTFLWKATYKVDGETENQSGVLHLIR